MKLVFRKDESSNVNVYVKDKGKEEEFSYVYMIKRLIASKKLDEPELGDGFSEAEVKSVRSMVKYINEEIDKTMKDKGQEEE